MTLRHNERDSISNHQPYDCLLKRLFRRRSKKTSKPRVTGLCVGNSPGTGEFPAQMASYAENVSIWWRHHVRSSGKLFLWSWLNSVPHFTMDVTTYPCLSMLGLKLIHISKRGHRLAALVKADRRHILFGSALIWKQWHCGHLWSWKIFVSNHSCLSPLQSYVKWQVTQNQNHRLLHSVQLDNQ